MKLGSTKNMHLLLFLVYACADTVLLRHVHGSGTDRHRDVIECVATEDDEGSLFSEEALLAPLVLPSALWCDEARRCHDRTSGREYTAETLVCDPTSVDVRCTARIDCTIYIDEFWRALATTFFCVVLLILVPGICLTDSRQRALERYDKDRSL